jgi:hypothetical protein
MPYGYILETSHGDRPFDTNVHHEQHHGGLRGWFEDHKHIIKIIHDDLIALVGPAVQVFAIWTRRPDGGRGTKVTDLK